MLSDRVLLLLKEGSAERAAGQFLEDLDSWLESLGFYATAGRPRPAMKAPRARAKR